jgi:circadian clock protein KaiC
VHAESDVCFTPLKNRPTGLCATWGSVGTDLGRWIKKGLLHFHAARPTSFGLEMHLITLHKIVAEFRPALW